MIRWAILTGEYPPQFGGVSDYTRVIAVGLAAAGDHVAVYAPAHPGTDLPEPGVTVHRLPDHFGPRGLLELDRCLKAQPRPDRILIQYVPHAFGWKAMNLPFTSWVALRAERIAPIWVMFHEVMFGGGRKGSIRHALLTTVTRQMARRLARTADRVFVSIPAWGSLLRQITSPALAFEWLPVPSNVPAEADPLRTASIRSLIPASALVLGHFGTYGGMTAHLLSPTLIPLLQRSRDRFLLLIGRGSHRFRGGLVEAHPELAQQIIATGELPATEATTCLAVCDLVLQPYPDGISCRRGSAMAGLAIGVPMVTNCGFLSEPIWGTESPGVTVVNSPDPPALVMAAESLLALPAGERAERGRAAARWYRTHFAPEHTIARLRSTRSEVAPPAGLS